MISTIFRESLRESTDTTESEEREASPQTSQSLKHESEAEENKPSRLSAGGPLYEPEYTAPAERLPTPPRGVGSGPIMSKRSSLEPIREPSSAGRLAPQYSKRFSPPNPNTLHVSPVLSKSSSSQHHSSDINKASYTSTESRNSNNVNVPPIASHLPPNSEVRSSHQSLFNQTITKVPSTVIEEPVSQKTYISNACLENDPNGSLCECLITGKPSKDCRRMRYVKPHLPYHHLQTNEPIRKTTQGANLEPVLEPTYEPLPQSILDCIEPKLTQSSIGSTQTLDRGETQSSIESVKKKTVLSRQVLQESLPQLANKSIQSRSSYERTRESITQPEFTKTQVGNSYFPQDLPPQSIHQIQPQPRVPSHDILVNEQAREPASESQLEIKQMPSSELWLQELVSAQSIQMKTKQSPTSSNRNIEYEPPSPSPESRYEQEPLPQPTVESIQSMSTQSENSSLCEQRHESINEPEVSSEELIKEPLSQTMQPKLLQSPIQSDRGYLYEQTQKPISDTPFKKAIMLQQGSQQQSMEQKWTQSYDSSPSSEQIFGTSHKPKKTRIINHELVEEPLHQPVKLIQSRAMQSSMPPSRNFACEPSIQSSEQTIESLFQLQKMGMVNHESVQQTTREPQLRSILQEVNSESSSEKRENEEWCLKCCTEGKFKPKKCRWSFFKRKKK